VLASYAVRWLEASGGLVAGKLELRARTVFLEGSNGHAGESRELLYHELVDGRPTLVPRRRGAHPIRVAGVGRSGVVAELAERIASSQLAEDMSVIAVVLPLKPGARARVEELLAGGPPFDPQAAGLERHEVFVSDEGAVFVFEAPERHILDRLAVEAPVWAAAQAWKDLVAGPPRLAEPAYRWRRLERDESIWWAPTPGPGDSEGGDIFAP
jgi:hypothetical protein